MTIKNWNQGFREKNFIVILTYASVCVFLSLLAMRYFLIYNDTRTGRIFNDPILHLFRPIDVTWITFTTTMATTFIGISLILRKPYAGISWMFAYSILTFFRIFTMYFVPLEPPRTMIFLHDPLISFFVGTRTPVHDLFFSGHTATAFMVYLGVEKKYKPIFLAATFAIGILVVAQHVHYSIDALAAPFFAYFSLKLGQKLTEFLGINS